MRTSATGNLANNPLNYIKRNQPKAFTMIEIIVVISLFAIIALSAAISISTARNTLSHEEAAKQFIFIEANTRDLAKRFNRSIVIQIDRDGTSLTRRAAIDAHESHESHDSLDSHDLLDSHVARDRVSTPGFDRTFSLAPFRIKRFLSATPKSASTARQHQKTMMITEKGQSHSYVLELHDDTANERKLFFVAGLTGQVIELDNMRDAEKLIRYVSNTKRRTIW